MTPWEAITWDVARAGGMTAYILLSLAVVAGLAMSLQLQSPRWPRIINNELHNFLSLLAAIFVGVHVLAVVLDPFTHFGLDELVLPFVSHYRAIWMAAGIVALYLGVAVGLSTLLRPKIGYALWRRLHIATFAVYALVTIHGIWTGSDATSWWGLAIYIASVGVVGALLVKRITKRSESALRTCAQPAPVGYAPQGRPFTGATS